MLALHSHIWLIETPLVCCCVHVGVAYSMHLVELFGMRLLKSDNDIIAFLLHGLTLHCIFN